MNLYKKKYFDYLDLGIVGYQEAITLQKKLHKKRCDEIIPDTILVLQHPNILTLGKNANQSGILADQSKLSDLEVEVHKSDRGGQVTYHCPGQLVIYFIVNIKKLNYGPVDFVRKIEEVIIRLLEEYEIKSHRVKKEIGVWIGGNEGQNLSNNLRKIAAIGLKVSSGVSMHGLSLNIDPNLNYYDLIIPCGIENMKSTSLYQEKNTFIDMNEVIEKMLNLIEKNIYIYS